jgi:stage II sporulation protein R
MTDLNRKFVAGWLLMCLGLSVMAAGWLMAGRAQASSDPSLPAEAAAASHDDLIRIHVIANSDSAADQALKLKVRDAVLELLASRLAGATTVDEAEAALAAALPDLEGAAGQVIAENGFAYGAKAELGRFDFPGKSYGDLYLPAGNYKALRIVIGEGQGANFWCLAYPSLCYRLNEVKRKPGGSTQAGGPRDNRW